MCEPKCPFQEEGRSCCLVVIGKHVCCSMQSLSCFPDRWRWGEWGTGESRSSEDLIPNSWWVEQRGLDGGRFKITVPLRMRSILLSTGKSYVSETKYESINSKINGALIDGCTMTECIKLYRAKTWRLTFLPHPGVFQGQWDSTIAALCTSTSTGRA